MFLDFQIWPTISKGNSRTCIGYSETCAPYTCFVKRLHRNLWKQKCFFHIKFLISHVPKLCETEFKESETRTKFGKTWSIQCYIQMLCLLLYSIQFFRHILKEIRQLRTMSNIAFARGGAHLPIAHALRLLSTKDLWFGLKKLNLRKNNFLK